MLHGWSDSDTIIYDCNDLHYLIISSKLKMFSHSDLVMVNTHGYGYVSCGMDLSMGCWLREYSTESEIC